MKLLQVPTTSFLEFMLPHVKLRIKVKGEQFFALERTWTWVAWTWPTTQLRLGDRNPVYNRKTENDRLAY